MNCESARDWLLQAENPGKVEATPSDVSEHVRRCLSCEKLIADLADLNRRWKELPLPARAETSKAAFLWRLQNPPKPAPVSRQKPRRFATVRSWVVAAALFIAVGIASFFFWPAQEAEARPDVIDQLVEWNLQLSEAPSPADRQRIYADQHDRLKKNIHKAKLVPSDANLAESLLANGSWMAANQNPVEELDRFNQMADTLLKQVEDSSASDSTRSERFATEFRKVNERGIGRMMERVRATQIDDPEVRNQVRRLVKHDSKRVETILNILEKSPGLTKKELRKAVDLAEKRHKSKKSVDRENELK